jgi:hypothetical protein
MLRCPLCLRVFTAHRERCPKHAALEPTDAITLAERCQSQREPLTAAQVGGLLAALTKLDDEARAQLSPKRLFIAPRTDALTLVGVDAEPAADALDDALHDPLDAAKLPAEARRAYRLAALAYELLAGEAAFSARNAKAVEVRKRLEAPPSLASARADLPAELAALITRALDRSAIATIDEQALRAAIERACASAAPVLAAAPMMTGAARAAMAPQPIGALSAAAPTPFESGAPAPARSSNMGCLVIGGLVLALAAAGGLFTLTAQRGDRAPSAPANHESAHGAQSQRATANSETPATQPQTTATTATIEPNAPMPIAPAQPNGTTAAASTQPSRPATTSNRRTRNQRAGDGRATSPPEDQPAPPVMGGIPPAITTQVSARPDAAVVTRAEGADEIAPVAPTAHRANERAGGSAPLQGPQREPSSLPFAVATFAALAAISALAYYLLRARRALPVAPSAEPARPAPANPELVATRISAVDTLHATLSATMPADGGAIDALAQTQVAGALGAASLRSRPGDSKTRTDFQQFSIGAYECVEQLGEGAMGIVYKARNAAHDRWCAVKVLVPDLADKPDAAAQFRREAKLASSVSHPNTVVVYDFGELDGGLLYLVMELLDGRTMDAVLRERALTNGEALELTRQLCAGLDALHAAGIIHQDLKPQNVMVSQRDGAGPVVKIVDFGLARLAGADPIESPSGQRRISGTPLYMAPEQARAEDVIGPGADLFSLAVVAYELLAGSAPFDVEGRTVSQVVLERASGHFHARSIATTVGDPRRASALDALFTEALAVEPERRPKSATEFYTRMNTALAA